MARVLPRDVYNAIDASFAWTRDFRSQMANRENSRSYGPSMVPGIVRLAQSIPEELLVLSSEEGARFVLSLSALEQAVLQNQSHGNVFTWPMLTDNMDCLVVVKEALHKCPEEAPSKINEGPIVHTGFGLS
jgi:hypothetical protein